MSKTLHLNFNATAQPAPTKPHHKFGLQTADYFVSSYNLHETTEHAILWENSEKYCAYVVSDT